MPEIELKLALPPKALSRTQRILSAGPGAAPFVLGWHSERIAEKERALLRQFRKLKRLDPFW